MQVDEMVAELLARGDMNDETVLDLNRMLSDWRAGKLDPDDQSYISGLHARIVAGLVAEPIEDAVSVTATPAPARLDGLDIEEWRERALRAEAELADFQEAARNG